MLPRVIRKQERFQEMGQAAEADDVAGGWQGFSLT